jgi:AbiV family abortive infection protein
MEGRRPRQSEELLDVLKVAIDEGTIWPLISEGICACVENAASLRKDFLVLVENRRFPAAQFMYVTCMEEVGKAAILFDVARTSLAAMFLPRLCRAFYNHAAKFAYARVLVSPGRGDLAAALEKYRIETIEYWHNPNPEDGEPDSLADGLYERESALYVDHVGYGRGWFRPTTSSIMPRLRADPEFLGNSGSTSGETEINAALRPLERAHSESLFCADAVAMVSKEFSGVFCNAGDDEQVTYILGRLAESLQRSGVTISTETVQANFMRLPIYAAIVAPERIPPFR